MKRNRSRPRRIATRMPMKSHLNLFQTMNLKVFHGDVNHKNEVSGRLKEMEDGLDGALHPD